MAEVDGCLFKRDGPNDDIDTVCTPCFEGNIRKQAVKYCQECQECLCTECTGHHERQKISRSHKLVDKNEAKTGVTTKCPFHPNREIEMYCREHDMVYCTKCIAVNHKPCTGVTDLEEMKITLNQKKEIDHLKSVTKQIKERLDDTDRTSQTNLANVEEQRINIICQIEGTERDLVEHILKLKHKALEALETDYTDVKGELETYISRVGKIKQNVEQVCSQLQTVDDLNDKEQFVQTKLIQQTVNSVRNALGQTGATTYQSLRFSENTVLKSAILTSTSLGSVEKIKEESSLLSPKIRSKTDINMTMEKDRQQCYISDICQLPDGTIILADYNNSEIKRLDDDYNIKDCYDLESCPTGICCTSNDEVAVKLFNGKIHFICVASSLFKRRDMSVGVGNKLGMTCFDGEIVFSTGNRIEFYSKSGTFLKTFCEDDNGHQIFKSATRQMAATGGTVIVADFSNGAVCVRKDGTVQKELRDDRLIQAFGVCVSKDGTAFISGYGSHNIVMFDRNGNCLGVLVNKDSCLLNPTFLLFDEKRNSIVATGNDHSTITVYNI